MNDEIGINDEMAPHHLRAMISALQTFDRPLASKAWARLYSKGARELCLEWIGQLDPFESVATALVEQGTFSLGGRPEASIARMALLADDFDFLDKLAVNTPLFCERFYGGQFNLAFSTFSKRLEAGQWESASMLLDRIEPWADPQGGDSWADESAWKCAFSKVFTPAWSEQRERVLDLARLRRAEIPWGSILTGPYLLHPDEVALSSWIQRFGIRPETLESAISSIAKKSSEFDCWDTCFSLIDSWAMARSMSGHNPDRRSVEALMLRPWNCETPLPEPWLRKFHSLGARFFKPYDGPYPETPPFLKILNSDQPRTRDGRAALARAQSQSMLTMLSIDREGIEFRFDARLPELPGVKRLDASSACAAKGLWDAAREFSLAGANWRFGSQVILKHSNPEIKEQAISLYESIKIHSSCVDPIKSTPKLAPRL